jgi:flagellar hook-associated protein 2
MSLPPVNFVGVSRFSESFQTVLERTFNAASLPVRNLQTEQTFLQARQLELGSLAQDLRALRDAFSAVGAFSGGGAKTVSSSNALAATATRTGVGEPIELTVTVTSAATAAKETALAGLPDTDAAPLSPGGVYKLTLGSTTTTIDLSDSPSYSNTLAGLRDALNAGGYGVTATILNLSDNPNVGDYRLLVTANATGATTLKLTDGEDIDLLGAIDQGSDAVFSVNGASASNSSNTVAGFAPGLSLTIAGPGTTTIRLNDDRIGLRNLLSDVAAKYNTVVARLATQIGKSAGVLSGDILIRETQSVLREITGRLDDGAVGSMAALGLELDDKGSMSLNTAAYDKAAAADFSAVRAFVGNVTSGFAGAATGRLGALADPVTGQIQTAIGFLAQSDSRLSQQIAPLQERIDLNIATLEARFFAADTLLAGLESQKSLLTQIFESQNRRD